MSTKVKKIDDAVFKVRICPRCKAVNVAMVHVCRSCGYVLINVPLTDKKVTVIKNDNKK